MGVVTIKPPYNREGWEPCGANNARQG